MLQVKKNSSPESRKEDVLKEIQKDELTQFNFANIDRRLKKRLIVHLKNLELSTGKKNTLTDWLTRKIKEELGLK